MRKILALFGVVVVLVAFVASTPASAKTRSATIAGGERSAKAADSSSPGALTIQRLLRSRLEWTRQLVRALRFLDLPPDNGTNTIIDEPDPAGFSGDPAPEAGDQEEEGPPTDVSDGNGLDGLQQAGG